MCVHLNCSRTEKGEVEFRCERKEDTAEEVKESDPVETIGPTEGGRTEMEVIFRLVNNKNACDLSKRKKKFMQCTGIEFYQQWIFTVKILFTTRPSLFAGLRRRVNVKKKEHKEEKDTCKDECEKEAQLNSKSEKSPCQHQDPLKWFGILVPQNLKQAQLAFKEGKTMESLYKQ